jgi:hypothetical protein
MMKNKLINGKDNMIDGQKQRQTQKPQQRIMELRTIDITIGIFGTQFIMSFQQKSPRQQKHNIMKKLPKRPSSFLRYLRLNWI